MWLRFPTVMGLGTRPGLGDDEDFVAAWDAGLVARFECADIYLSVGKVGAFHDTGGAGGCGYFISVSYTHLTLPTTPYV